MECLSGAGGMLGQSLGGFLIDLWKFSLPYYSFGVVLALLTPLTAILNHQDRAKRGGPLGVLIYFLKNNA